jgi:hypothetical protein
MSKACYESSKFRKIVQGSPGSSALFIAGSTSPTDLDPVPTVLHRASDAHSNKRGSPAATHVLHRELHRYTSSFLMSSRLLAREVQRSPRRIDMHQGSALLRVGPASSTFSHRLTSRPFRFGFRGLLHETNPQACALCCRFGFSVVCPSMVHLRCRSHQVCFLASAPGWCHQCSPPTAQPDCASIHVALSV